MLNIQHDQRVVVWEVEDRGTWSSVKMGSSRKDKSSGEYRNSNWSYVHFVGQAHEKAATLQEKDRIVLKGAGISLEPYIADGEKRWPKSPQIVVFNFEWMDRESGGEQEDDGAPVVEDSETELPF